MPALVELVNDLFVALDLGEKDEWKEEETFGKVYGNIPYQFTLIP